MSREDFLTMRLAERGAELERMKEALEEIDAVAVSKKAGAAKRMQAIARKALAVTNGERGLSGNR